MPLRISLRLPRLPFVTQKKRACPASLSSGVRGDDVEFRAEVEISRYAGNDKSRCPDDIRRRDVVEREGAGKCQAESTTCLVESLARPKRLCMPARIRVRECFLKPDADRV